MVPVTITIGAVLLGLALLILLGLVLARPFFRARSRNNLPPSERQKMLEKKEALLDTIRALDFDHDTGKIPDQEYEQQRAFLLQEAADTLKLLEEMPVEPGDEDIRGQIEAAIDAIRSQRLDHDDVMQFCARCGQPLDSNDQFCARCGTPVYAAQPTP